VMFPDSSASVEAACRLTKLARSLMKSLQVGLPGSEPAVEEVLEPEGELVFGDDELDDVAAEVAVFELHAAKASAPAATKSPNHARRSVIFRTSLSHARMRGERTDRRTCAQAHPNSVESDLCVPSEPHGTRTAVGASARSSVQGTGLARR